MTLIAFSFSHNLLKQHSFDGDIFHGGMMDNTSVLSTVVAGGEHYYSYNIYQVANKEK